MVVHPPLPAIRASWEDFNNYIVVVYGLCWQFVEHFNWAKKSTSSFSQEVTCDRKLAPALPKSLCKYVDIFSFSPIGSIIHPYGTAYQVKCLPQNIWQHKAFVSRVEGIWEQFSLEGKKTFRNYFQGKSTQAKIYYTNLW